MERIFTFTESFSVTPPLRIRYVSMHYGSRFSNTLFIPPHRHIKFRKAEDGCVDICFYDWLYFGFRPLNHISALSTVKRYKFSQSTLILKQTTHNFSKSPSKSLLWLNQRQVVVFYFLPNSHPLEGESVLFIFLFSKPLVIQRVPN